VSKVRHHPAVGVDQIGAFMSNLRMQEGMGAKALAFAVLTAARSGEVRGATWAEIDMAAALWIVPDVRMKSGREHRVPLSKAAVKLLRALKVGEPADLVFPGLRGPLSDMSLTAVLRRMAVDATAHGFRSTFRDWVAERTTHTSEVAEMALGHAVGDKVEAAYRRGDLFAKRVALMNDWAEFVARQKPPCAYQRQALAGAQLAFPAEWLTDRELHGLADTTEQFNQRVDREFRGLLVHDIGDTRARHHQDLRRIGLLELMFGDPVRKLEHQLLLEQTCVVDLLARCGVQLLGLCRRETQFQEQVCASLRDVANFRVDRHRLLLLALTTER
jgi:hypothetical protein